MTGEPEGYFDCDLYPLPDGDGVIDLLHGTPERSWIDLDGGTDMGTNDLFYFIEGVDEYTITFPTWFAAIVANRAAAYNALEDMVGQIVLVPVFDNYCFNSDPRYNSPPCTYDTGDIFPGDDLFPVNPDDPDADTSEQIGQTHYRVVSLSPFHITCIQEPSGPIVEPGMDPSIDTCPGLQRAFDLNETLFEDLLNPGEMQRIYSIEGYFVEAYAGTGACDTPYAGVYTLYLK